MRIKQNYENWSKTSSKHLEMSNHIYNTNIHLISVGHGIFGDYTACYCGSYHVVVFLSNIIGEKIKAIKIQLTFVINVKYTNAFVMFRFYSVAKCYKDLSGVSIRQSSSLVAWFVVLLNLYRSINTTDPQHYVQYV